MKNEESPCQYRRGEAYIGLQEIISYQRDCGLK